ncbi:hypothetical protein NPIL_542581 [Nephila pilipes]|uniref:Uncharacterized protein n=1 Tax=Nephila pilipes TaxID=299642 RepID=A0A8X6NAC8_NEPPI|nr:hypothetical protein NPIL_542581 [Nephila pilipes]
MQLTLSGDQVWYTEHDSFQLLIEAFSVPNFFGDSWTLEDLFHIDWSTIHFKASKFKSLSSYLQLDGIYLSYLPLGRLLSLNHKTRCRV